MKIGNREFDLEKKTYIMGILNITPDSFSDGGKWNRMDHALSHVEQMISDGVDIIDIGGESTRPGYTFLSDEEEISRVVPVIEKLKSEFDIPLSIDTYKSEVAKASINAGIDLINDIWGLKFDSQMAKVIGEVDLPCCLMHNRKKPNYTDYFNELCRDLQETLDLAKEGGIKESNIILDPGIGFAKSYEENLQLMNHLEKLHAFNLPILLGTSRKSMIGITLDLPVAERIEGTIATTVIGVMKGCSIIRVHDIKENKRAVLMTEAILNS
ncbi:MAG: dihydropteroate synthase [Clostridiales bacterium]|nr:dihydropteroate synthase [Clostridiales bacterium]